MIDGLFCNKLFYCFYAIKNIFQELLLKISSNKKTPDVCINKWRFFLKASNIHHQIPLISLKFLLILQSMLQFL